MQEALVLDKIKNEETNQKRAIRDVMFKQDYRIYINDDPTFVLMKFEEFNVNYLNVYNLENKIVGTVCKFDICLNNNQKLSDIVDYEFEEVSLLDDYKFTSLRLIKSSKECFVVTKRNIPIGNFSIDHIYKCGDI